jgi:hypothetical protein
MGFVKEPIVKNYVAITIEATPKIYLLEESRMPKGILSSGPIFHSWLRGRSVGIIGIKFSSWMIRQGNLTKTEKSTVALWNKSETDFEVFFGTEREYDGEANTDDESGHTYVLRLDGKILAICFPLFSSSLGKAEIDTLASSLPTLPPLEPKA